MKHDTHRQNFQKDNVQEKPATPRSGSEPSSKETVMLVGGLLVLTLGIAGMWMVSEDEPLHANASKAVDMQQVSKAFQPVTSSPSPDQDEAASSSSATLVSLEQESSASGDHRSSDGVDIYFEFDQAALSEDAKVSIQEKVDQFKENQGESIIVQGHTDQRGSDTYNKALGLRRAKAVKTYLVSQGIPESSIQTKSLGSQNSICSEDSEECFQQNRRAQVIVTEDQLSASSGTPLMTETTTTEQENLVTVESDNFTSPLSEENSTPTTALLTENDEGMASSESTPETEAQP